MYDRKRIFIGSSKESLDIAREVKAFLSKEYYCTIWEDDFFDINQSTYDTLVKNAMIFDYAIFIGGKDDFVTRNNLQKSEKVAPRDNVYLEFGLYAGMLSPSRTFFLIDNLCSIATDLLGITVCTYQNKEDVEKACKQIQRKLFVEDNISRIKLLPSTSLAIGYYENFIKEVYPTISEQNSIKIGWKKYRVDSMENRLKVIIPDTVSVDWYSWANKFYKTNNLIRVDINCNLRKMGVMLDYNTLINENRLCFIDVPLTLKTSFSAVELWCGKDYIGETEFLNDAKAKEVVNFIGTLNSKISEHSMDGVVSIEIGNM